MPASLNDYSFIDTKVNEARQGMLLWIASRHTQLSWQGDYRIDRPR
jgi:hypothetical protein